MWVSLVRNINHLNLDRKIVQETLEHSLVLKNLVARKSEEITGSAEKEALTALYADLDSLHRQLEDFLTDIALVSSKEFQVRKRWFARSIKHIKKNIYFVAKVLKEYEINTTLSPEQMSRREFLKKIGRGTKKSLLTLLIGSSGMTAGIYKSLLDLAKDLPLKKRNGLAVLISYNTTKWWDTLLKPVGKLFIPAYVARIEIAFGQKANIVRRGATSENLYEVIKDSNIQNVVIYGHGSWYSWLATDKNVLSFDLMGIGGSRGLARIRKSGLLLRHTCGEGRKLSKDKIIDLDPQDWIKLQDKAKEVNYYVHPKLDLRLEKDNFFDKDKPPHFISLVLSDVEPIKVSDLGIKGSYSEVYLKLFEEPKDVPKQGDKSLKKVDAALARNYPALRSFYQLLDMIKMVLEKEAYIDVETIPLFGVPIFKREKIKGWDRIASPWDFMIDVFGSNDRSSDQLYGPEEKKS